MKTAAALLVLLFACEYRDLPNNVSLQKSCFDVPSTGALAIHAQVSNGSHVPIDGVHVAWRVDPASVFSLQAPESATAAGSIDMIAVEGTAVASVKFKDDAKTDGLGVILSSIVVDNAVVTATAELRGLSPRTQSCPSDLVDAGVDSSGSGSDAAADAPSASGSGAGAGSGADSGSGTDSGSAGVAY